MRRRPPLGLQNDHQARTVSSGGPECSYGITQAEVAGLGKLH